MPTRQPSRHVAEAFDAYVLDLDGTVCLGDELLPGVAELIDALGRSRRPYAFSTNNPTRSRADYAAALRRLGVPAIADQVVTSGSLTAAWIRRHRPGARCFVVGEPPLLEELASAGVELTDDPASTTLVVSSFDRTLTYAKLQTAFDSLRGRPETGFIATHPDAFRPLPSGRGQPDAAAVTAAIEACTGRRCQAVIGKPSAAMMTTACDQLGVAPDRAIMVGDRLRTDIAAGIAAGTRTGLVLTGETSLADVADCPEALLPDYILQRIDLLAEPLLR